MLLKIGKGVAGMKSAIFLLAMAGTIVAASAKTESPYVGQEQRSIKALSTEDVDAYLEGKGHGYAKAAELNHYPGPLHVLDLAEQLGLSEQQVAATEDIYSAMKHRAKALGRALVDKERELDLAFASGSVDSESLAALVTEIGDIEAEIRFAHLNAHLEQKPIMTRHQVMQYDKLRGYGTHPHEGHEQSHEH
jgi:Spy/CpxP family protein refolding chaperone